MRKMYYRPQKVSSLALIGLAGLAIVVVVGLRHVPAQLPRFERWTGAFAAVPDLSERMLQASRRTAAGYQVIRQERVRRDHLMLDAYDPAGTGMIGPSMSLVTTLPGHLEAKLTSVNPNFAAVAMRLLVDAGVRPGDRVAIGCTGSFPALNIAVICAAESLGAKPVLVSSAASSQFGANAPDLMWPDMENLLVREGIIQSQSVAVSRGGFRDRADGMDDVTREMLEAAIARNGRRLMDSRDDADAIERRMVAFAEAAGEEKYAAYVNVGGGDASIGGTIGNDTLGEGVIRPSRWTTSPPLPEDPAERAKVDSVAARFLATGVPVVNLINTVTLARRFGLPVASATPIEVGRGSVFALTDARRIFAILAIILIAGATALVMRPPARLVRFAQQRGWFGRNAAHQPRWMV